LATATNVMQRSSNQTQNDNTQSELVNFAQFHLPVGSLEPFKHKG